jgi:hypothetical protein
MYKLNVGLSNILSAPNTPLSIPYTLCGQWPNLTSNGSSVTLGCTPGVSSASVVILTTDQSSLNFCELQVFGTGEFSWFSHLRLWTLMFQSLRWFMHQCHYMLYFGHSIPKINGTQCNRWTATIKEWLRTVELFTLPIFLRVIYYVFWIQFFLNLKNLLTRDMYVVCNFCWFSLALATTAISNPASGPATTGMRIWHVKNRPI